MRAYRPRAAVNDAGQQLAYAERGEGPLLVHVPGVLLGGLTSPLIAPSRDSFYVGLARACRVVSFDMRGAGRSEGGTARCDLDSCFADLEAVVTQTRRDEEPLHLLGVFHGAGPAIRYAAEYPEQVASLILFNPYLDGQEWSAEARIVRLREAVGEDYQLWTEAIARWSGVRTPQDMAFLTASFQEHLPEEVFRALVTSMDTFNVKDIAASVRARTLVLHTQQPEIVSRRLSYSVAEVIPTSEFHSLELPGSFPQFSEDGAHVRRILDWLGCDDGIAAISRVLTVCRSGAWFQLPDGLPIDIRRRRILRALLLRLVAERERAPGHPLSLDELVSAGWPETRVDAKSAAHRAYVALSALRKLGLRDVLVHENGGYQILPDWEIRYGS